MADLRGLHGAQAAQREEAQAVKFLADYLGPAATTPPTAAVRVALRKWLLSLPLSNPLDAGAASSPRNVPGTFPDAYAVFHGIVTPTELRPRWDEFLNFEHEIRGLPDGPLAEPISHVLKSTHYTVTQHWLIAHMHDVPARAKLAGKIAVALGKLSREDSLFSKSDWIGPSRAIGWMGDGNVLERMATGGDEPLKAALVLAAKLNASKGGDSEGHVWLWQNEAAKKDDRHVYDQCPWQDAPCSLFIPRLYALAPVTELRDLMLHQLRVIQQAQCPDGHFVDDIGFDINGVWGSKDDGKPTMDGWIVSGLHAIHHALNGDVPAWVQPMMALCKEQIMGSNRYRPTDPLWHDAHNQAISIQCAPLWGFSA